MNFSSALEESIARTASIATPENSTATTSPAFLEVEIYEGAEEWEVVHDGPMPVRSKMDLSSDRLVDKMPGTIVPGKRTGNWIALYNEPGFMRITLGNKTFLRVRSVSYSKMQLGSCSNISKYPIYDAGTCEKAGFALGYYDSTVSIDNGDEDRPEGCYEFEGELWVATSPVHRGKGAVGKRMPLCSSGFYPTTTTTGTSTTTSTTSSTSTSTSTSTTSSTNTSTTTNTSTSTSTSSTTWGYPSLFCVEVVRTQGYELPMVKAQQRVGASIFSCEEFCVFSDGGHVETLGTGPDGKEIYTIVIPPIKKKMGNLHDAGVTTDSWLNTETFLQVWNLIDTVDGRWKKHHWTVKVDPDAVFFPDRLRQKLRGHTFNSVNLFVMNCDRYNPVALYGSLEIFSNKALATYLSGQWNCRDNLPWHGWGEDFFMSHCMDHLNVGRLYDFSLIGDKRCHYAPCTDPSKVVYHDYKTLDSWFQCWHESSALG